MLIALSLLTAALSASLETTPAAAVEIEHIESDGAVMVITDNDVTLILIEEDA